MTKFRDTLVVGAALILGTVSTAGAADLYRGGGSMKDTYMPAIASSPVWYVRVDGGIAKYDAPMMVLTSETGFQQDLVNTSIGRQWAIGGGVGIYRGNFRIEGTIEHRFKADVKGDALIGFDCPCTGPTNVLVTGKNHIESTVYLANFYYDFNRDGRFNPYIGAGLGVARNRVSAGSFTSGDGSVSGTIEGHSNTHVAGALMAGVDVKLRDRLHFDAGYRFLYLGEAATGPTVITSTKAVVPVAKDPTIEQLHAHEFRFGLRYDIQ